MRCPTCSGAGFVLVVTGRSWSPLGQGHRTTECPACGGTGERGGEDGLPDDDGELPIGWSPPLRQLFPRWTTA